MNSDLLVWMDLEMTGLDPERERILEIAVVITNAELEIKAEGPNLILHQSELTLGAMDKWNQEHHQASGLLGRVRASTVTEPEAEEQILEFVRAHCPERTAPLAGNSVYQDRRFLCRYMPRLDAYLHYRLVDVSTVKELVKRWHPHVFHTAPRKASAHRAIDDIRESIAELRHYRTNAFRP